MRILVFSDSHRTVRNIRSVLDIQARCSDCAIHLGDGAAEFLALRPLYTSLAFYAVAGNCDIRTPELPPLRLLSLENVKIYLCHGHILSVKATLAHFTESAAQSGADLALFGHTHIAYNECISDESNAKKLILFNPGSISQPHDGTPSYGIIDIGEHGIHCHINRLAY